MGDGKALTVDELNEHLGEQIEALRFSCSNYDAGNRWEAKRIASAAYILCHDPPVGRKSRSKSLLDQIGLKSKIDFISTANPMAKDVVPALSLTVVRMEDAGAHFVPAEDAFGQRRMRFSKWYEEPIFYIGAHQLSRKNLIHAMRSTDGGAHVDEVIRDAHYQQMKFDNDVRLKRRKPRPGEASQVVLDMFGGSTSPNGDDEEPVPFAHFASMRQIGYELLLTLEPFAPAK